MATTLNFPKLPPLKALRGFESTARMRSFRKAAEELNLTHPAISHQIRSLEMAMDGEGITLVNGPFADKDLKAGRLVQPVAHCAEGLGEWGLVCRKDTLHHPPTRAFIEWLQADMDSYK